MRTAPDGYAFPVIPGETETLPPLSASVERFKRRQDVRTSITAVHKSTPTAPTLAKVRVCRRPQL